MSLERFGFNLQFPVPFPTMERCYCISFIGHVQTLPLRF
ncbi:hypothetical protein C2W58_01735 [Bacillus pumilus]|nr:hypothetical protein C2W58_01735 [Bacillus pumilus]